MAVIIGGVTPRDTEFDNATLNLSAPWGVHALSVGDRSFVYAAGPGDSGISGFELGANGSLTSVFNVKETDNPIYELSAAINFASAVVGGATYLYVNAAADNGISAWRVEANGTLTNVDNETDGVGATELNGTSGRMATAAVGATSFLIASGQADDGFSVFRIDAGGTLTNTANVDDVANPLYELDGPYDVATAIVNGRTFIFAGGTFDDGISVFELDAGGNVTFRSSVDDASNPALNLNGQFGLATAAVDGTTYLISSGLEDAGLSVFSVSDTGLLTNVFNIEDTPARGIASPTSLTTFTLDSETFVAASGYAEATLGIFHLGAGGVLTDVTTIFDSAATALGFSFDNALAVVDGNAVLIGSGFTENGISTFDLGSGNDTLTGTVAADTLLGLAGNDTLNGAGGEDRMLGGTGDDTYVVDSAGDEVEERTGGGTDTVRAARSYTLDANLENLELLGGGALDGTGNGLDNGITGNGGTNSLRGLGGRDNLAGLSGTDDLDGGRGNDRLAGGAKADTLLGGQGRDVMEGGGGADDFVYTKVNQSGTTNATRDQILDFKGQDDIVFTQIDAVKGQPGNQNFTFDTNGSFSAGEIRFREVAKGVLVELNVDNDQAAELSILLKNFTGTLANNDFEV